MIAHFRDRDPRARAIDLPIHLRLVSKCRYRSRRTSEIDFKLHIEAGYRLVDRLADLVANAVDQMYQRSLALRKGGQGEGVAGIADANGRPLPAVQAAASAIKRRKSRMPNSR